MRTYQVWAVHGCNTLCYQDEEAESKELAITCLMANGGILVKLVAKSNFLWLWY